VLLGLSVLFHAAVLGGLSLGWPVAHGPAEAPAMAVTLVDPPPFVRTARSATPPNPRPSPVRAVVVTDTPPRYAAHPAKAATGDAQDAVDLFGPVFADGLWPRPVLVGSEPCDPTDASDRGATCRRETLLIGLASDAAARSKAQP
jgi:hypothetical protein